MKDLQLTISTSGGTGGLCINVPVALAEQLGLSKSTRVYAKVDNDILVIFPVRHYRRQELLACITPENIPNDEWDLPA